MERRKQTRLGIGSVSSGTMRPEDLIPEFLAVADGLRLSRADRQTVRDIARAEREPGYYGSDGCPGGPDVDPAEDLDTLFDLLGNYVPDYCTFGAHPGDGADYGVWPVEELFETRPAGGFDGCIGRVNDPSELRHVKREYSHAVMVNDHGNVTLYRRVGRRWVKCWSTV